ncbi:hypothetical protein [Olleya sp. Bg11-27]|uniref:hypothetical protein n=1 Tax=Olleya sp. Bg11-27 TaxID=2058135 RepID=UPI000C30937A|nr:hypothetical protein [Olleya sp. Bg11-27]AUC76384.1 hypothetical protein CW732_12200 [Olleya sp. Bg11-27]
MKYVLFSLIGLVHIFGYTHETNEAFFKITQKENTIEIEAEFPWTIRNALINYNPLLEHSVTKIDFQETFANYIKDNLILKNKSGAVLSFQDYQELENNGHSHQNNYLLLFNGTNLFEISNTIMFNIYDNQVNYNTVTVGSKEKTFKTSNGASRFVLDTNNKETYWYVLLLVIPIIYITYRFKNKKNSQLY